MNTPKNNLFSRFCRIFQSEVSKLRGSQSRTNKRNAQGNRLTFEMLEQRTMLNAAPVLSLTDTSVDIKTEAPYYIPLTSTDSDGDTVYYKVEVVSGDLTTDLSIGTEWQSGLTSEQLSAYYKTRNPYWQLTVNQQGNTALTNAVMQFELCADKTPATVAQIKYLTESEFWTSGGNYYDYTIFHRIISNFMVQGGGFEWFSDGLCNVSSLLNTIEDEFDEDLQMTGAGVLAMANTGDRDSSSGQFFITTNSFEQGNFSYTVFGHLVTGQETLNAIANVQTADISSGLDYNYYYNGNWYSYKETQGNYPTMQGFPVQSTTSGLTSHDVYISSAKIIENTTGSVLTIRSANAGTAQLKITPIDANGLEGAAQYITVNTTTNTSTVVNPPFIKLDDTYFCVDTGIRSEFTIPACDVQVTGTTSSGVGYAADLYYIKYDAEGKNGTLTPVTDSSGNPVISCDYATGKVSIDASSLEIGTYYLQMYVGTYSSNGTATSLKSSYTDQSMIAMIVTPGAPTSISIASSDDSDPAGDGKTTVNKNISYTVDGCTPGYTTAIFCGSTVVGYAVCAEGATSVTIESTFGGTGNDSNYPYGRYDLYAVQVAFNQSYYRMGVGWASVDQVFSSSSDVVPLYVILPTPEDLQASNIQTNAFDLSWSAVTDADSYYIEFRKKGDTDWTGGYWDGTSCGLSSLDAHTTYEVRLTAVVLTEEGSTTINEAANSISTAIIEVTTVSAKLDSPQNVQTSTAADKITVTWEHVEQAASYNVYYKLPSDESFSEDNKIIVSASAADVLSAEIPLTDGSSQTYIIAIVAVPEQEQSMLESSPTLVLTVPDTLPLLSAQLFSWEQRANSTFTGSINEWQAACLKLTAGSEVRNNDGYTIVIRYDSTLYTPDFDKSELSGVYYSWSDNKVENPLTGDFNTHELIITVAVSDATAISNQVIGNIYMTPADQSNSNSAKNGVTVLEQTKDFTVSYYTNSDNTTAVKLSTAVWAVPYDLDDSGVINMSDFITFATNFNQSTDSGEIDIASVCDFNDSSRVDMSDFILFATHFNASWNSNSSISIPKQTAADATPQSAASALPTTEAVPASDADAAVIDTESEASNSAVAESAVSESVAIAFSGVVSTPIVYLIDTTSAVEELKATALILSADTLDLYDSQNALPVSGATTNPAVTASDIVLSDSDFETFENAVDELDCDYLAALDQYNLKNE